MPNRIRALREERAAAYPDAFRPSAVAQRLGVTDKTLRSWEQGVRRPTGKHARALARYLGVSIEALELDADDAPTAAAE